MHQNTRAIASIWRWERVAARSVSARRILQKRALNGHFWTTKGRLAVNWGVESKKFCHQAFFQGRLPLYANFWPSSMKKCNRPQIRFFFYHYTHFQNYSFLIYQIFALTCRWSDFSWRYKAIILAIPIMSHALFKILRLFQDWYILTRRLSRFEILNNTTLIFQKWLVSRHFANIFHNLNFSEEYLWQFL